MGFAYNTVVICSCGRRLRGVSLHDHIQRNPEHKEIDRQVVFKEAGF